MRRSRRRSTTAALLVAIACAAMTAGFEVPVRAAVSLTAIAPLGASAGINVQITGTGFDPVASNNTVTLTPQTGAPVTLVAETIAVLDAARGLRRIGITVPAGLAVGSANVLVRNRTTNESAGGRTLQIIQITLPQTNSAVRGAQGVAVRIDGSANVQFVAGRTTPTFGAGITVGSTQVLSATSAIATVSISPTTSLGPRTVNVVTSTQTAQLVAGFTVAAPNRPPTITSSAVTGAAESQPYLYQVVATDPDGDPLTYRLVSSPSGMTMTAGLIAWTPANTHVGNQSVVVEAMDGRGGTAQQSFQVTVAPAVQLQSIDLQPSLLRFSVTDTTRPVSVTGQRTNGTTVDLTSPATGTTYESSNAFVARVAADGTVTGVANGSATITARNGALSDTAAIVVEAGVALESLELTPGTSTLRSPGSTQALALRGRFSDGSVRDLTTAAGTTYESSNPAIAGVGSTGTVTAVSNGQIAVTARHDTRAAAATVVVNISSGVGFLRGEAYDDSKGLPLGQVTVSLLSDGGGTLATPVDVVADDRGQFSIAGRAGDAIVRIAKTGFTAVERRATIPATSSVTLFDARLTPLDPTSNLVSSAVGGQAQNQSGRATLQIPPGGLPTDQSISLTLLSPQGLGALLPAGWSPIAAVAIEPASLTFGFPVTLTVPNAATLSPSLTLAVARFDASSHEWMSAGTATIDAGGLTLRTTIERSGQFAFLAPDPAPFTPAEPTPGAPLTGVDRPANQMTGVTAVGDVVPRSAPPGDDARALGRVGVTTPAPAPSGTFLQARVSERFDLLDQTHVVTQPFTQDLVSYATPRPPVGGALGAAFPITPSRSFTIQELMLGVIRLDVTPFAGGDTASVVDPGGGTVTSTDGDTLQVPAGALPGNVPIALRRLTAADAGVTAPAGFDLLAALEVDLVGVTLSTPAQLSTAATGGITAQDQILVARAFTDPFGQRRLELVAIGELSGGRLITRTTLGSLTLAGVRSGGEFAYLRAQQPIGFVTGTVTRSGGAALSGVLVTSDSVGIADITGADGRYLVAGRTGVDTTLRALDPASRDSVSAILRLDTAGQILTANLALNVVGPTVVAVAPAAGSTGVALDTSVTIDFSEALDPASVTSVSVVLQLAGTSVAADRSVSADARRVVLRPSSPLVGVSTYTLQLTTGLHDVSGNPLTGYTPASFTTLDPSRPAGPAPGRIVAELPDESGFVLITGAPGVAAGGAVVTVINVRTQETASVLALADGSFRLRVSAVVGDELTLILRGVDGRDTTIAITQFVGSDGSITVGAAGGTIPGPGDRVGTILPRALAAAGTFHLEAEDAAGLPLLPGGFAYADSFALSVTDASFKTLASLTLTESQNRFAPATSLTPPFAAAADLTTPPDALANSTLRFTAVVSDADGVRRTVGASTTIVAGTPNGSGVDTSHASDFPTLFVTAPQQALPAQQVGVSAISPAARVELETPLPASVQQTDTLLLAQKVTTTQGPRLAVLDQLSLVTLSGGSPRIRTTGRVFPGMTAGGHYAIVSTHDPLVFVTGIVSGAQATVFVDGLPFVFTTGGANGRFIVPVRANASFTLRFYDATGTVRGTASGLAPASGTTDVGDPLGSPAGLLTVTGEPNERSVVDINASLVLRFSEPVDAATVASALVVTDDAGSRVYGRLTVEADALSATFTPSRRWRFGTRYRYGLATTVLARSGARLRAPFSSQFTTFQPAVVGTLPVAGARDVAVAGATAVVATSTGIATVDVSSPRAPRQLAQLDVPGGAHGVSIISTPAITDRNGQSHTTPVALVAAGGTPTAGTLRSFDLSTPSTPVALGSTQLTTVSGQSPPANVPGFVGTPRSVTSTLDGYALVAIEGVGVSSVQVGQAIPLDATVPARGAGARYPSPGAESASDVVRLGNRVLVGGATGLTVLDATLQRVGGVSTTGNAQGVAALPAFRMDVNGDGAIDPASEVFDLAVVANGIDGTLQLYRVPAAGDPVLLSAVRFAGAETTDVQVDAAERLAYTALGARGLAIVDLDGPASVQPIDTDRNGLDDRVLGSVEATVSLNRLVVDPGRGLVYGALPPGGVAVSQVLPPRTRFLSVSRDPGRTASGDEQVLSDGGVAFTSDEAIRVALDSVTPDGSQLSLVIDEQPVAGARSLSFTDGSIVAPIADGLNQLVLIQLPASSGARVSLNVVTAAGQSLARFSFTVESPPTDHVVSVFATPPQLVLTDSVPTTALSVSGVLEDGRILNITRSTATIFASSDEAVVTVGTDGTIQSVAGGHAEVTVTHHLLSDSVGVLVARPPALIALSAARPRVTLTATEPMSSAVVGRLSDGSEVDASGLAGIAFSSSDAQVVTVDQAGLLRAVGNGVATVRAAVGTLSADLIVAVELRAASSIVALHLAPPTPTTTDSEQVRVQASVEGTGPLDLHLVTFATAGGAAVRTRTNAEGIAVALLPGFGAPGVQQITASVSDPSTGAIRTDTAAITIAPGTGDNEPNDADGTASPLGTARIASGVLTPGSDGRDTFRIASELASTLTVQLTLLDPVTTGAITLVVRSPGGTELSRVVVRSSGQSVTVDIPSGGALITLELTGSSQPVRYTLSARLDQGPVTIASVAPAGGGPGTPVVITGSGFSAAPGETTVLFAGVRGRLVSASATQLVVRVPANAADGDLEVVSGTRGATGPRFVVGRPTPAPFFAARSNPEHLRHDPQSGAIVDVSRLWVDVSPDVDRSRAETLFAPFGGTIVGILPSLNRFLVEFETARSLAALAGIQSSVRALSEVELVTRVRSGATQDNTIDQQSRSGRWANGTPRSAAFEQIQLFNAIEAVRRTPPLTTALNFHKVRVAVIDTGFNPFVASEFGPATQLLEAGAAPSGGFQQRAPADFAGTHGTGVTGILAGFNDGSPMSGVVGSLYRPEERVVASVNIVLSIYYCGLQGTPTANSSGTYIDSGCEQSAYEDIRRRNFDADPENDVDIVNMSYGAYDFAASTAAEACAIAGTGTSGGASRCLLYPVFQSLQNRTLFVAAAGNEGIQAWNHFPSAMQSTLTNVIAVGAVAVGDTDGTGETADYRAFFRRSIRRDADAAETSCDRATPPFLPLPRHASNCGPGVTLTAPGEDLLTTTGIAPAPYAGPQGPYEYFNGTSGASPVVAGLAALLQTIRPSVAPLSPGELRRILIDTGDDITSTWNNANGEQMRRINALAAVRRLLPTTTNQRIYIAEQQDGEPAGRIVALSVDPLEGQLVGGSAIVIPLTHTGGGMTVNGRNPFALSLPTPGDRLYALAQTDSAAGDGVFVLSTSSPAVSRFIPLSGDTFPPTASPIVRPPVRLSTRSPMVASRTGRLLFIGHGASIIVVDTINDQVVSDIRTIDWPQYTSRPASGAMLILRDGPMRSAIRAVAGNIVGLEISADNRTLYVLVQTGSGTNQQPGLLLEVDVALDRDRDPSTTLLEPDLSNFFTLKTDPPQLTGQDEPGYLAASPDGNHLYVTNGGVQQFVAVLPNQSPPDVTLDVYAANMTSVPQVNAVQTQVARRTGYTQLLAAGIIQAFSVDGSQPTREAWRFPSELSVSWTPTKVDISDQFHRTKVNSELPAGLAFRPDGNRALVAFGQTGNFGVLDIVADQSQPRAAPAGIFNGLVAVTPSLTLDNYLVPPPEEEARWFPTRIVYAQNSRFAVASHKGRSRGAITILDDDAISTDLARFLTSAVPEDSGPVPVFRNVELCNARNAAPSPCAQDVFRTVTSYDDAGYETPLGVPRDIAIQPFVNFSYPALGDWMKDTSPIVITWRDTRAVKLTVKIFDLGSTILSGQSATLVAERDLVPDASERNAQTLGKGFKELFTIAAPPADRHRYRLEVELFTADDRRISKDTVEVFYKR